MVEWIDESLSLKEYCQNLQESFDSGELKDSDFARIDVKIRADVVVYFWTKVGLSEWYLLFAENYDFNEVMKNNRAFIVIAKNMFKKDNAVIICNFIISSLLPIVLEHDKSIYILHFASRFKDISKSSFVKLKPDEIRTVNLKSDNSTLHFYNFKLLAKNPNQSSRKSKKSTKKFPYYGALNRDITDGAPWRRITKDMVISEDRAAAVNYFHLWSKAVSYRNQKAVASFFEDHPEVERSFFSITIVTEVFENHSSRKEAIDDLESMPLEWRKAMDG